MGYLHIDNLYKNQDVLAFKECYALEKVHGTSAWLRWEGLAERLLFHSGGANASEFRQIFDEDLEERMKGLFGAEDYWVFGEAYGGKIQKMRHVYGDQLRFVVFDVRRGPTMWYRVEAAHATAKGLGLEFVPYERGPAQWGWLDEQRDRPSEIAVRRGIEEDRAREGIVIRPVIEVIRADGKRVIAKHKTDAFSERRSRPGRDPEMLKVLEDAEEIAREWVVPMRLEHVLDKLGQPREMGAIPRVIRAMVEDVLREAEGEIIDTKYVRKAIGKEAARLYKALVEREARERSK